MTGRRVKKLLIITVIAIVSFVVLLVLVASPLAGYFMEKYDEKYTGRRIEAGWVYLNPLTGYMHIRNLKIFEKNSNKIFFSASGFTINVSVLKLLSNTYEISRFRLKSPKARIVRDGENYNFSDLIRKFSGSEEKQKKGTSVRFSLKNIRIRNGEFHYIEKQEPINYFIKNVNFESEGKTWDVDTIGGEFSFLSGPASGSIRGNFTFNVNSKDYRIVTSIRNFELEIAEQFIKKVSGYGQLKAALDASLQSSGNLNDSMNMSTKGRIVVNNFHLGRDGKEDLFSFEKLLVNIKEFNLKKGIRVFDTIMLVKPDFQYELHDSSSNIGLMFGSDNKERPQKDRSEDSNPVSQIAGYIKMLQKTFVNDYYKIGKFAVEDASIRFSDFSLTEKFSIGLNPLNITADSIDKNADKIEIKAVSKIQPYGSANIVLTLNPVNTGYFDLWYKFSDIPAALFNPYVVSFTSYPLKRGTIEFHGDWNVDNSVLNSENHFVVVDPTVSKKVRKRDEKWVPMPLIMSVVRERGNVIDYKIPIKGNLKDPDFKISDAITDVLKNILVKPPSTPYILEVHNTENEIEKSLSVKWEMRAAKPLPNQEEFIEKMAEFLDENPEASITVNPMVYGTKEKEHILFYQAKKKYFLSRNNTISRLDEEDSMKVEELSVKDPSFVHYLDTYVKDTTLHTIQQKCRVYVGNKIVQEKYTQLIEQRQKTFLKYFKENGTDNQIKILSADNTIPYNGFSYYDISYKGDIPDELLDAYRKMEDYNEVSPRKRYRKWRN